jgi:hypothetical protein
MITQKPTWLDWEDNLVTMIEQLNPNQKPTNKQKRLIKIAESVSKKHDYTKNNLFECER